MARYAPIYLHEPTLSLSELEDGLRVLQTDRAAQFWEENVVAFRQTVLAAIRDTSHALTSPDIPVRWRIELEGQLEDLQRYLRSADEHIAARMTTTRLN